MSRKGFRVTLKTAKELLEDPYNCVEKITSERRFPLPISFVNKVYKGVSKQLIRETGRYSAKLEGIVLATDNIKIIRPLANVVDDLPYIIVDIGVDFIVFKPNVGSTMTGTVTKTGVYYISCLVHSCFNVSIQKSENTELFERVKEGDSVVLEVISVQYQGHIVQMQGKLLHIAEEKIIKDQSKTIKETNGDHIFDINSVKIEIVTTEEGDESVNEETELKKQKIPKHKKAKLNSSKLKAENSSSKMELDCKATIKKPKKKKKEYYDEEVTFNSQLEYEMQVEKSNSDIELDQETNLKKKGKKIKTKDNINVSKAEYTNEEEKTLDEDIKKHRKRKRAESNFTSDYENNSQIAEEGKEEEYKKKKKKQKKVKLELDYE